MLHASRSTESMNLSLESYSTDESRAVVGVWVLIGAGQQEGVGRSGWTLTPNVRNTELSASWGVKLYALVHVV